MSDAVIFEGASRQALSLAIHSAVALFLTGICIVLTVIAVYFLRRRGAPGHHVLSCALGTMCLLAIGQTVSHILGTVWVLRIAYLAARGEAADSVKWDRHLPYHINRIEDVLFSINYSIADSVFIYRCYVIWSSSRFKKRIIAVPVVLLLATTVLGLVASSGMISISIRTQNIVSLTAMGFGMATNMTLTGLTAGRIWWTRRYLRIVGETKVVKRYNTAVAMIIESGAASLLVGTLYIIALSSTSTRNILWNSAIFSACEQLLVFIRFSIGPRKLKYLQNIIPMLVIVRISLGRSVEVETADRELA
ncbi:hypothetical protein C8J57DRAFT_1278840 [Mycena rebaudengoi]|nr:hypothetical protein C8J57DRAFT_1278840 [Mycena rebaudengoi]